VTSKQISYQNPQHNQFYRDSMLQTTEVIVCGASRLGPHYCGFRVRMPLDTYLPVVFWWSFAETEFVIVPPFVLGAPSYVNVTQPCQLNYGKCVVLTVLSADFKRRDWLYAPCNNF
jgi:hypothetical protein